MRMRWSDGNPPVPFVQFQLHRGSTHGSYGNGNYLEPVAGPYRDTAHALPRLLGEIKHMANTANEPTLEDLLKAPIVRGDELPGTGCIDTSLVLPEELYATADPADVAVLIFWRFMKRQGKHPTTAAVWEQMVAEGLIDEAGGPILLETVQAAADRLVTSGLIACGGEAL